MRNFKITRGVLSAPWPIACVHYRKFSGLRP